MDAIAFEEAASMGHAHKIVSKSSGKCLNWGLIVLALTECDATSPRNMMWTYSENHLEAFGTGQCLDLGGMKVHIWQCRMTAGDAVEEHQHWALDEETGQLRHAADNVCLAANGNNVATEVCDEGSIYQKWHVHAHAPPQSAARAHKPPTETGAAGGGSPAAVAAQLGCALLAAALLTAASVLLIAGRGKLAAGQQGNRAPEVRKDEDQWGDEAAAAEPAAGAAEAERPEQPWWPPKEAAAEPAAGAAEAERPEQLRRPPEGTREEAPPGLRLDFQAGSGAVRTVYAKRRPLGIRHGYVAPLVAHGFTVNSYAKQELGVEEGWKLRRIGDEELHDNPRFHEVDGKLAERMRDLELWPLPIGFKPSHESDEVTTVEFREKATGLEFTSAAPIKVSKVHPSSPAEGTGVREGWCVVRVGEADVTQDTDFHEFLGYFNEGVLPLGDCGDSYWLPV